MCKQTVQCGANNRYERAETQQVLEKIGRGKWIRTTDLLVPNYEVFLFAITRKAPPDQSCSLEISYLALIGAHPAQRRIKAKKGWCTDAHSVHNSVHTGSVKCRSRHPTEGVFHV
jgi:hypothetical protein